MKQRLVTQSSQAQNTNLSFVWNGGIANAIELRLEAAAIATLSNLDDISMNVKIGNANVWAGSLDMLLIWNQLFRNVVPASGDVRLILPIGCWECLSGMLTGQISQGFATTTLISVTVDHDEPYQAPAYSYLVDNEQNWSADNVDQLIGYLAAMDDSVASAVMSRWGAQETLILGDANMEANLKYGLVAPNDTYGVMYDSYKGATQMSMVSGAAVRWLRRYNNGSKPSQGAVKTRVLDTITASSRF